jgi:hypothetical protein
MKVKTGIAIVKGFAFFNFIAFSILIVAIYFLVYAGHCGSRIGQSTVYEQFTAPLTYVVMMTTYCTIVAIKMARADINEASSEVTRDAFNNVRAFLDFVPVTMWHVLFNLPILSVVAIAGASGLWLIGLLLKAVARCQFQ